VSDFTRSFPLEDIQIRAGGDGRTVEAYAAVFGQEVPISDADGRYMERVDPSAFNKTLADLARKPFFIVQAELDANTRLAHQLLR